MKGKKWPKKAEARKLAKAPPFDKRLLLALIGLVVLCLVFAVIVPVQNTPPQDTVDVSFKATANGETILDETARIAKGTNALVAMQSVASIEFQDFGAMGVMIEAINGVKPGQNEFWKLFVNGEEAMTGISSITIEEDTAIEWRTASIESYTG